MQKEGRKKQAGSKKAKHTQYMLFTVELHVQHHSIIIDVHVNERCRRKAERSKQGQKRLSTPNTCYSNSVGATGLWVHVYTSGSVYVGHEGIARVV